MLKESPHWPPPMPSEKSVHIASKMFFKHLRALAAGRIQSKFGQALLRSITNIDRASMTVDEDCGTQDLLVNVSIQREVRRNVEDVFKGSGEMTFEMSPYIVAEALNTLPEDVDLQVLADFLAASL